MATTTYPRPLALATAAGLGIGLAIAPPATMANIVVNGSFESPSAGPSYQTYGAGASLGGWTVDSAVDHLGASWQAARGTQSVDLNAGSPGAVHQDLSTRSGATYRLRFAMAGNPDTFCPQPIVARISVRWGESDVAQPRFDTTGRSFQDMGWTYFTRSVTAAGAVTRLAFASLEPQGACGPTLDDVSVVLTTAPPPPVIGETVNVRVVSGKVFIKVPGGDGSARASQKGADFEPLTAKRSIPVRSILDTRQGTVSLTSARNRAGKTQSGQFADGVFQVLQSRKARAKGLTELRMKGSASKFKRCNGGGRPARAAAGLPVAQASLSRRTIRRLRARARGRYRTRGRHSAATVRGTTWTVQDRCDGTLTKVKRGKVAVRDFRLRKTILLTAGKSYLAAPR